MKKVRLGLIGAGWVAQQHLEAIRDIDWIEAVAITSRTISRAQALAKEYGLKHCCRDLEELVLLSSPDALMVLVSEDQMYKTTHQALSYKLPLFIEKPPALFLEENQRLADLAEERSIPCMVGYNRRFYSIFHKGLEIIRKNGPLMGVQVEGHERMWRIHKLNKFSQESKDNWIFANSTHTIDLLRFFGGEVNNFSSIAHKYREKRGDQFAAIMQLSCGSIGQYTSNWYSPGGWRVVLYGDKVTVEFKPLENGQWIDEDFRAHSIIADRVDTVYKPGFYKQMESFGLLVRDGIFEWPMQDLKGSYKTMDLAEQMTKGCVDCSGSMSFVKNE